MLVSMWLLERAIMHHPKRDRGAEKEGVIKKRIDPIMKCNGGEVKLLKGRRLVLD